ncbi:MAG: hypothetical protein ACR2RB_08240 [Gammaproteobacteria bacterium]
MFDLRTLATAAVPVRGILAALLLAGCAHHGQQHAHTPAFSPATAAQCREFLAAVDRLVDAEGVRDTEATRVPGFPYARADRFLVSLRDTVDLHGAALDTWVDRLRNLDLRARRHEISNLPASAVNAAKHRLLGSVEHCGVVLSRADLADTQAVSKLFAAVRVAPDYQMWKRVLGLYPLTGLGVLLGVHNLRGEIRKTFATPVDELAQFGRRRAYGPPPTAQMLSFNDIAQLLSDSAAHPIGIPEPNEAQRRRLFDAFAPLWRVDVVSDDDRIGRPVWGEGSAPEIDVAEAHSYRRISHTWFGGEILLQLNYQIWFPARTVTGAFDMLGGHIDGIIWRVTLGTNGRPLIYDAMHNCGCYHMFFPTDNLRLKRRPWAFEEPLLVAAAAPPLTEGERIVIDVANISHYLQHVDTVRDYLVDEHYVPANYDSLRALPLPDAGTRSLFQPDGIVPGTQRGERWILWPMGVRAPGAMRQWGHHATAFVGRRHFDDPYLFERYFEAVE